LEKFARVYKRQIAVFFLPYTPPKTKRPTDYRNIELVGTKLSVETLLAIRRTDKFRDFLLELNSNSYYKEKYSWLSAFDSKFKNYHLYQKDTTFWLRKIINYSFDDQINDSSLEDSYNNWRNSFENDLGIYTFQFSLPQSEIQGFCYSDTLSLLYSCKWQTPCFFENIYFAS